jgi:acyl carrier protein
MAGALGKADLARLARGGLLPLGVPEGLALFDAGCAADRAATVAVRLELGAFRERPADEVPELLRGLVRGTARRAATGAAGQEPGFAERVAALPAEDRVPALLDLVRRQVADVLGHASAESVPAGRPFKELGFDSLTAVELRARLGTATGLRLPATLVFDYPTPGALAAFLDGELPRDAVSAAEPVLVELDRLEAALTRRLADGRPLTGLSPRLRALLDQVASADPEPYAPAGAGQPVPGVDVDSASDDELFAFVDSLD